MLRRNEKSSVSSPSRRPLSPPNNNHPKNPLFKSKPENNYPLNNDCGGGGKEAASRRISQSTSGLNCLMMSNGLDSSSSTGGAGETLSGWRSDPRLSESNGANFAIRHVSCRTFAENIVAMGHVTSSTESTPSSSSNSRRGGVDWRGRRAPPRRRRSGANAKPCHRCT